VVTTAYASASFANKNVGTAKAVSVSGISISGADAGNYHLTNTTAATAAAITARDLHVSAHGVNKTYDTTTAADVSLSDDAVAGDHVTLADTSAAFGDKNVGTAKTVSVSGISISGDDASNYQLVNSTASTSADITQRNLTATATGVSKIYDGNTNATVGLATDKLDGDYVVASSTNASFADKNVGTGKAVSVGEITIWGDDAANYHLLNTTAATTAGITARDLTVSAHGIGKTYDATTDATVTLSTDAVTSDDLTPHYTDASFANKNVATGKTVAVSGISISGADAGNYHLVNITAGTTGNITRRDLHVSALGVNKVYDGNSTANVTLSTDKVTGDLLSTGYAAASFADRNVGNAKLVSVSGISISGTDAGNYNLVNTTATTSANIGQRNLTVGAAGVDKIYDANTTATVTLSSDEIAGDHVTAAYASASFANKNVGSGKAVSASGISISGGDAGNYHLLNTTAATTANITRRDLTLSAAGVDKVYDGNTTAAVTLSSDKVTGDTVTAAYTTATFDTRNVGSAKVVAVSGIWISGADATNYNLVNTTAGTTANITRRDLHVSALGVNKVYDGNSTANVTLSTDKVTGDLLSTGYAGASFAERHVGNAKLVSVSGISISGTDAGNYNLVNTTATTSANLTARAVTVQADPISKILGATDPALTYTVTFGTLASGDSWAGSLTRDSGETVGAYAIRQGTVNVSDGNSGNNYAITFTIGSFRIVYATSGTCNGDGGHMILQPINFDGSSVFKQGSTVPAKFRVCDVNGNSIGPLANGGSIVQTLVLNGVVNGTVSPTNETIVSTTPDTAFRWDPTSKQWIFNISTKNLSANRTYQYVIGLNDGSTITFQFGLK
jgi:hypothetical protein